MSLWPCQRQHPASAAGRSGSRAFIGWRHSIGLTVDVRDPPCLLLVLLRLLQWPALLTRSGGRGYCGWCVGVRLEGVVGCEVVVKCMGVVVVALFQIFKTNRRRQRGSAR